MDPSRVHFLVKWFNILGCSLQIEEAKILRQFATSWHLSTVAHILTNDDFPLFPAFPGNAVFATLSNCLARVLPESFTSELDEKGAENGDVVEVAKFMTLSFFAIHKKRILADKVNQIISPHLTDKDIKEGNEIVSFLESSDGTNWAQILLNKRKQDAPRSPPKATNQLSVDLPNSSKSSEPPKKRPRGSMEAAVDNESASSNLHRKKAPTAKQIKEKLKEAEMEIERLRMENRMLTEELKAKEEQFRRQVESSNFEVERLQNVVQAHQRQKVEREDELRKCQEEILELKGSRMFYEERAAPHDPRLQKLENPRRFLTKEEY